MAVFSLSGLLAAVQQDGRHLKAAGASGTESHAGINIPPEMPEPL